MVVWGEGPPTKGGWKMVAHGVWSVREGGIAEERMHDVAGRQPEVAAGLSSVLKISTPSAALHLVAPKPGEESAFQHRRIYQAAAPRPPPPPRAKGALHLFPQMMRREEASYRFDLLTLPPPSLSPLPFPSSSLLSLSFLPSSLLRQPPSSLSSFPPLFSLLLLLNQAQCSPFALRLSLSHRH